MTTLFARMRGAGTLTASVLALICLALVCLTLALPVQAAESDTHAGRGSSAADQAARQEARPLNNAPVWRAVRSGEEHFTVVRTPEAGVLIQSEGNTWRQLRNGPITLYGGWLLILVPLAILAFWLIRGKIKLEGGPTGRQMKRFSGFERFVHWGVAITFVLLAFTGVGILFGKHLITPLFGHAFMAGMLSAAKLMHNYVGPLFGVFIVLMIFTFMRDNVWQACDAIWIRRAGGLFGGGHVPSSRFNFGEKTWFWIGVTAFGLIVVLSGLVLDFPNFGWTRGQMQIANVIHAVGAILLMAMAFGHIYMGTIGAEGAFDSMRTGYVDETWAKEHHEIWYDEVKAGRSGRP